MLQSLTNFLLVALRQQCPSDALVLPRPHSVEIEDVLVILRRKRLLCNRSAVLLSRARFTLVLVLRRFGLDRLGGASLDHCEKHDQLRSLGCEDREEIQAYQAHACTSCPILISRCAAEAQAAAGSPKRAVRRYAPRRCAESRYSTLVRARAAIRSPLASTVCQIREIPLERREQLKREPNPTRNASCDLVQASYPLMQMGDESKEHERRASRKRRERWTRPLLRLERFALSVLAQELSLMNSRWSLSLRTSPLCCLRLSFEQSKQASIAEPSPKRCRVREI